MIEDPRLMFEIAELTIHSLNGALDEKGLRRLEELLARNPVAVEYYQEILWTFVGMKSMEGISCLREVDNGALDGDFWRAMLQEEKDAPVAEMPEEETPRELIQKIVHVPQERKISKFNIFTLAMSVAAVLFLVLFLHFAPPQGVEVATLTDSIHAEWTDVAGSMNTGTRLATNGEELYLKDGLVELLFDNHAKVVIEGPAEFELLAEDRIKLNYGNIYSCVPPEAIGFSIFTQNAKIFDMGTEFGVEADFRGNTLLHVIKGSTMLVARDQSGKKGIEVSKGAAKKITAVTSEISDISCDYDYFVRDIDSQANVTWRGKNLSLASIVAGLDGFMEIDSLSGLDPLTGELVRPTKDVYKRTSNAYNVVAQLKYIDGVFVPDGESGAVQITSTGQTFDCPDTSGIFTHEVIAYKGAIKNQHSTVPPVIIDGQEITNDPILMLHSNIGITFDLQAIRRSLPQLSITSLQATGTPIPGSKFPEFKFWILVDGEIKYEREIVGSDCERGLIPFNIAIGQEDRFVTLVVTDELRAADNESEDNTPSYASDFFYLIQPELCLTDGLRE